MRPGTLSIGLSSPRHREGTACVDHDQLVAALEDLVGADRVAAPLARDERRRLDVLVAGAKRAAPALDPAEQDGALGVTEVAQQPPQALGAAHVPVRDDEDAVLDARSGGSGRERARARQRMPSCALDREVGQVGVDVEEGRAGDVPRPVERVSSARVADVPAAVDEAVVHSLTVEQVTRSARGGVEAP